ncbi:MAG: ATP-dependent zinc metalloprotease FtsH [Candidatus Omnitrophota bacterium]|nr:MAG: ATP-dependent zinc metalloprotease FtsH [Candidatus Omnitrophota bacterium]
MKGQMPQPKIKPFRSLLLWLLIIMSLISLYRMGSVSIQGEPYKPSYSEFYQMVKGNKESGQIASAVRAESTIEGKLSDGRRYIVYVRPENEDIDTLLAENVADFSYKTARWWAAVLYSLGPMILFILVLWFFFYRGATQGGGRLLAFGKSRAKELTSDRLKTTFKDVAGVDEAKEELQEVIEFLKDPKKFQRLGGKIPKGVLLLGPPGCGKTLLARAVAGEANVPFFSISGSDFVEMFVGVGASRVRDLFEQAKKSSRVSGKGCIIFIDEIDAVGRQRFAGIGGGHDEREQTLNALLVEMDGFDTQEGIILVAATNRPDVLDPALLRPGRFDRRIVVDRPDLIGREEILKVHTRTLKLDNNVDLKSIARQTAGFSGADLANLANEAALLAARRNKEAVGMKELEASIERVIAGPERKSKVISKPEKKLTAYHEAGHALLALLLPEADPLHKVSILPRGMALGYTMTPPIEDRHIYTKDKLMAEITMTLGGRASEELILQQVTTGAQNDLEVATDLARRMVCEFGMSAKLGHRTFGKRERQVFLGRDILEHKNYSDQTALRIDEEVHKIVDQCYRQAKSELSRHRDELKKLADALLEKEVLSVKEVKELTGLEASHQKAV